MNTSLNLVIADDEPHIRENLRLLFPWDSLGISVVYLASNGQEVLEYMADHPVDIILADIRMPVMDGLSLARVCMEHKSSAVIVLLSAYADFEYARSAMRYGVSAYLTKPVNYTDLMDTFQKITRHLAPPFPAPEPDRDLPGEISSYKGYYQEIVTRIQTYIKEHVDTATLNGAAELTGLSASYVSTIFHRHLNQTFSDYLTAARMEQACVLLKSGCSVADTAWKVGYNNPRNFERIFRQHFQIDPYSFQGGQTPS